MHKTQGKSSHFPEEYQSLHRGIKSLERHKEGMLILTILLFFNILFSTLSCLNGHFINFFFPELIFPNRIFNPRFCPHSGGGFGVSHTDQPMLNQAQMLGGFTQGHSKGHPALVATPGGPCFRFAPPAASFRDACKLQGWEPGRPIPWGGAGGFCRHLQAVSTASAGNMGETRASLSSSGGLALVTREPSHFQRSLCQTAAPIFELTFPRLNPLSLWAPSSASRKRSPRLCDPPPLPSHPSWERVFIKRWIRNVTRQVTGCQVVLSELKIWGSLKRERSPPLWQPFGWLLRGTCNSLS